MSDGKKWAAGGVIAAIIGLAVGIPAMVRSPEPGPLERQVRQLQADEQAESPAARHEDVANRIARLQAVTADPDFSRLPAAQADYVRGRLRELRAYQAYAKEVEQLPDPAEAETRRDLEADRSRLEVVKVPAEYQEEWKDTEAGRRHAERLADLRALQAAADQVRDAYRQLANDGSAVLKDKNAPNLPKRARAVLARAKALPGPRTARDKKLPGSARATYATVFRFEDVQQAYAAWDDVKATLEPIATL